MSFGLTPLSSWIWEAAVLILCLGAWAYGLYVSRFQSLSIRTITSMLRLIILIVAWLVVHEFTVVSSISNHEPRKTIALLDRSGSMSSESTAESGETRLDQGLKVIEKLRNSSVETTVFSFNDQLTPGLPPKVKTTDQDQAKAVGSSTSSGTDYMTAITQLTRQEPDLGQMIMISDGHDFSPLSRMSAEQLDSWIQANGVPPIHTVYIGSLDEGPDLLIHSVEAPSFSYIRSPLKIDVTLLARNLDDLAPQVQLLEDQKIIQFQTAVLDEHGFGRVSFEIYPDLVGEHLYQIHLPPETEEKNTRNNTQSFLVKTGRDKINVLHIAGSVTPDLQGLRSVFERDPFIEFTAFYILRTQEHTQISINGRLIPPDEMALVQFPVEEIFDRQLYSFDVVIFQDFDAGNYFRNSYQARKLMRKISTFVTEQRGGLIFISGPRTAAGPSLALTSVGDILPIPPKPFRTNYQEGVHALKKSGAQKNQQYDHPLLQGFESGLPNIYGYMQTNAPHRDTRILLETKTGAPVLATRLVGKGRTLFLNTSSSWVWRREAMARGETSTDYDHFWRNMLKWASGDPSLNPRQIQPSTSQENPLLLRTEILLRDNGFVPQAHRQGVLLVQSADETVSPLSLPFTTSKDGRAVVREELPYPGFYKVTLQPNSADKGTSKSEQVPGQVVRNLFIGGSLLEYQENDPRPETLRLLSSLTGGTFFETAAQFSPTDIENQSLERETVIETHRTRLRDSVFLLPLILFLAGLEWFIRRQNHLA